MSQAEGASEVMLNSLKDPLVLIWLSVFLLFLILFTKLARNVHSTRASIGIFSFLFIVSGFILPFFYDHLKGLQEFIVPSSFLDYYAKASEELAPESHAEAIVDEMGPDFLEKLEAYGLRYDLSRQAITFRDTVYSADSSVLIPEYTKQKPNLIIVFLEGFSNDISSLYNSKIPGLTPSLEAMAQHSNTTVFQKYYNASTPTVTGMLSQLCSFLPPTGHEEMQEDGTLVEHNLLCLPEILRDYGYDSSFYLQAVEKSFSRKDRVLVNAGVPDRAIYGSDEVGAFVRENELESEVGLEPLSWGYSDHQLFPVFWNLIEQSRSQPFLAMMTTIDTHVPYTNSQDMLRYPGASKPSELDAFYTSDDAFGDFWKAFIQSDLSENTILIAVADHAVFPTFYTDLPEYFPEKDRTFYDEMLFLMYVPEAGLPKNVTTYASGLDFTPTLLQVLGINIPNYFEGHSIFDDRSDYPNLLGSHEFQLYINDQGENEERNIRYDAPKFIADYSQAEEGADLSLLDFYHYYEWKRQMMKEGRFWKDDCESKQCPWIVPELIAHAGGGIGEQTYTNSLEALNENYLKGFRYFEMDFSWTQDEKLVLIHDWEETYRRLFGRDDGKPYSPFFRNLEMNYGLTQMTLQDLAVWLDEHPDVRIITDVKEDNLKALKTIKEIANINAFIPQVYNEDEINQVKELGFSDIILTLYRTDYDNEKVLEIARQENLYAITMSEARAAQGNLLGQLKEAGRSVYVHTINDRGVFEVLKGSGAQGVYTDFIGL
ncbi:MAG: sulfatase-like hydrolase/transferase [Candidatus Peregrinibacteria bacterium]|nr:sulfatase-like hydrolase/transferase [Candidatus Peregrinibacteria bacterium]